MAASSSESISLTASTPATPISPPGTPKPDEIPELKRDNTVTQSTLNEDKKLKEEWKQQEKEAKAKYLKDREKDGRASQAQKDQKLQQLQFLIQQSQVRLLGDQSQLCDADVRD